MVSTAQVFSQSSLVVIFTYAQAGLGHLRVTDALYHGLPETCDPVLLRTMDKSVSSIHRLTSLSPFGQSVLEFFQSGAPEEVFTKFYRFFLRTHTKIIYQQISNLLDERMELPKEVLVVATHFGLAHQLASIKDRLAKEKYVKIFLVVQVTDDTSQHIWYVPGADLTMVPSQQTKEAIQDYAKKQGDNKFNCEVVAYPINPLLYPNLPSLDYQNKVQQLSKFSKSTIHVAVPISGAAVGTKFISQLIDHLSSQSDRFAFHVLCLDTPHTKTFINQMKRRPYVRLITSPSSREVINQYIELYQKEIISLEITKPSEQAFKALYHPKQIGGSILLFTQTVGLQEVDNYNFLARHGLLPGPSDQQTLYDKAARQYILEGADRVIINEKARHFRALNLPTEPVFAAKFIWWTYQEGILENMIKNYHPPIKFNKIPELSSNGVKTFWETVNKLIQKS